MCGSLLFKSTRLGSLTFLRRLHFRNFRFTDEPVGVAGGQQDGVHLFFGLLQTIFERLAVNVERPEELSPVQLISFRATLEARTRPLHVTVALQVSHVHNAINRACRVVASNLRANAVPLRVHLRFANDLR